MSAQDPLRSVVLLVGAAFIAACGGNATTTTGDGGASNIGGASAGGGTSASGGASTGETGGTFASGGAAGSTSGSGGQPSFCATPQQDWLPAMKICQVDDDCVAVATYSCCGPGTVYGLSKNSKSQYTECFTTSPPQDCPPLGCASQGRTEDGQPVPSSGDLSSVVARCVDGGGGVKECTSTLQGSCVHNVTRCSKGDTCTSPCGASCTCQNGYVNCERPTGTCSMPSQSCEYLSAPATPPASTCTCAAAGAAWSCQP